MGFEEENYLRLQDIEDNQDNFTNFESYTASIIVIPKKIDESKSSVSSHTGEFSKWIKNHNDNIEIQILPHDIKVENRSEEFWLTLVNLCTDMTLQVYLGMVSNYLYDKTKGALSTDNNRVSLEAIYHNPETGKYKKFSFKGNTKTFQNRFKTIDMNKFYDE